jgi:dihydropteroate synthase
VVEEITNWLEQRAAHALDKGVRANRIILDPGIGFGKRLQDNLDLIRNLDKIKALGYPVLMGVSRKSFIHGLLNVPDPGKRLGASLGAQLFCARNGADIIRTHDVLETRQSLQIETILKESHELL